MSSRNIYFLTDDHGNKTHAVMPIATYNALMGLADLVKNTSRIGRHEIYVLKIKNVIARGYPDGPRKRPAFVLIKDSQAVLEGADSLPQHVKELREKLLDEGKLRLDPENECFMLTQDLRLKSSSLAAAIVSGNVRNGLDVWMNREGFSLKESGYGHSGKS